MRNLLVKILSINPLLSLALVIGYVAFIWYVTTTIWSNGNEFFAILFALSITITVKLHSVGLIEDLKQVKLEKLSKE